jgi:hypothetical protein
MGDGISAVAIADSLDAGADLGDRLLPADGLFCT